MNIWVMWNTVNISVNDLRKFRCDKSVLTQKIDIYFLKSFKITVNVLKN